MSDDNARFAAKVKADDNPGGGGLMGGEGFATVFKRNAERLAQNPLVRSATPGLDTALTLRDAYNQWTAPTAPSLASLGDKARQGAAAPSPPGSPLVPSADSTTPAVTGPRPTLDPAYGTSQQAPVLTQPSIGGGGGAGGGGVSKLKAEFDAAQKARLGVYDTDKALQGTLGEQKTAEARGIADLSDQRAALQDRMAQIDQDAVTKAQADEHAITSRHARNIQALRESKPELGRVMRNKSLAAKTGWAIAAAIDGGLAAMSGSGKNDALDRIDHMIDQDYDSQLQEFNNKKSALTAEQGLVGQMMQQHGNEALARLQHRSLLTEALKGHTEAQAARLGIPQIDTNAKILASHFDQQQKDLDASIKEGAYKTAQAQAAAGAAAQKAAEQKKIDRINKLADDFAKGTDHDAPMSPDAATARARAVVLGEGAVRNAGYEGPLSATQRATPGQEKDLGERTVVVDGKEYAAKSKDAAEKWDAYTHGREVFSNALQSLKEARAAGDVGKYNSARATLIEEYPKLLGYTRAPTQGQIEHTVGPEAIPEYNHWYSGVNAVPVVGNVTYAVKQGRNTEAINELDKVLGVSDKAMREATLGTKPGARAEAPPGMKAK